MPDERSPAPQEEPGPINAQEACTANTDHGAVASWSEERAAVCRHLLSQGFRLFPVVGKRPFRGYCWKGSTGDHLGDPVPWERYYSGCNLGILTGGGLYVVDIDSAEGEESWKAFNVDGFVPVFETLTGREGGGRHLWFGGDAGKNGTGVLPGIDIKSDDGYVVAPPSVHETGAVYTWKLNDGGTWSPPGLAERIKALPRPGRSGGTGTGFSGHACSDEAFRAAVLLEAGLPEGFRELDFFPVVNDWLRAGLTEQEVWEHARRLHQLSEYGNEPFEWADARKRTTQALKRHAKNQAELAAMPNWSPNNG